MSQESKPKAEADARSVFNVGPRTHLQEVGESVGLLVLRLAVGGMMLTHGWPKFHKLLEAPEKFADPFGLGPEISLALAVFAELVCAALIVIGLGTRLVAGPLLFTMLVAAFIIHGGDPFKKQEMALLYGAGALALMLTGGGQLSLDAVIKRVRGSKKLA